MWPRTADLRPSFYTMGVIYLLGALCVNTRGLPEVPDFLEMEQRQHWPRPRPRPSSALLWASGWAAGSVWVT